MGSGTGRLVVGLGVGVTDGVADGVGADGVGLGAGLGADGLGSGVVDELCVCVNRRLGIPSGTSRALDSCTELSVLVVNGVDSTGLGNPGDHPGRRSVRVGPPPL